MINNLKAISSCFIPGLSMIPRLPIITARSCTKCFSTRTNVPSYTPLLEMVATRQTQARKSVLVQVKGPNSGLDLASYCQDMFGKVSGLYYFNNTVSKNFTDFFIVEFDCEESVGKVMRLAQHQDSEDGTGGIKPVPVYSPFLWFQGVQGVKNSTVRNDCEVKIDLAQNGSVKTLQQVMNMSSVSEQMYHLWNMNYMTDTSLRLRFLVCRQLELAISGMFPNAQVLPFGSAINGFGTCSSDQDMILVLDKVREEQEEVADRLVFQAKGAVYGNWRDQVQRYCEEVADIMQKFLPGCQDVQKILHARVPIIKYFHQFAGLECDLSMSSSSGLHMSCLLHLWGDMDWRVRPLVTTVRRWASSRGLVKQVRPTHFFTNFTLTMLVVCYLQQVHSMLPSLNKLVERSSSTDFFVCEDGIDIQFLHNISGHKEQLNSCFSSPIPLSDLLLGFLNFYSVFDFSSLALCPISGSSKPKQKSWRNSSAMDLINPLEPDLNVSYNVNLRALDMFQNRCREDSVKLQILLEAGDGGEIKQGGLFWLFDGKNAPPPKANFSIPRIETIGLKKEVEMKEKSESKKTVGMNSGEGKKLDSRSKQRGNNGVKSQISLKKLFPDERVYIEEKITTVDVLSDEKRVQNLKAKYLRSRDTKAFDYKV